MGLTVERMINIALPKGRLGEKAYKVFEDVGYGCPSIKENNRKLTFENSETGVRYFWVKPSDVAIYVEHGVADIGVVGKDILLEGDYDIYELLDLGMGKCKMVVAGATGGKIDRESTLRVATKFPNIAKNYFIKQSVDIDIIKLHGSIEIAPILGMSDVIVDIVETGITLKENNLEPWEEITNISARLIANPASHKFLYNRIGEMCSKISSQL